MRRVFEHSNWTRAYPGIQSEVELLFDRCDNMTNNTEARAQQDWSEANRALFEINERIKQRGRVSPALYNQWVTARLRWWIARAWLKALEQEQGE
jgi:hypothetical protein